MTFANIRTDRLLLRQARSSDAEALAQRRSEPETAEYQSWTTPYPLEAAAKLVEGAAAMAGPANDEWWMLTIANPEDTKILGDIALHMTWEGRAFEIGYSLTSTAWGNGYATEAVGAVVARLFETPRTTRIHAMLHPDNIASAHVLERTGFVYEGRTRLSYWVDDENTDDLLYGLTRDDYACWHARPRTAPLAVRFVEITADNVREVRQLVTHKSQERFVAPVTNSFGAALYPEIVDDAPLAPWLRAVEADGDLVGFVMLSMVTDRHREPSLWRFLVDRRHQRRGIGARALELAIDECKSMGVDSMLVYWCEGRGSPKPLYLNRGFVPTGTLVDGEVEARLRFNR